MFAYVSKYSSIRIDQRSQVPLVDVVNQVSACWVNAECIGRVVVVLSAGSREFDRWKYVVHAVPYYSNES